MKDTRRAKSRIDARADERRQLAIAMARDTLSAATRARCVDGVLLVCDRPEDVLVFAATGVRAVVRPDLDINEAVQAGVDTLRGENTGRNVAALPADLPYLRSAELDVALGRAAWYPRGVVADRAGTGTTLLTARADEELMPAYGAGSWNRHLAAHASEIWMPLWSGLRRDVDFLTDLVVSPSLGPRTRKVARSRAARLAPGGPAA